jgi:hypothetical protein
LSDRRTCSCRSGCGTGRTDGVERGDAHDPLGAGRWAALTCRCVSITIEDASGRIIEVGVTENPGFATPGGVVVTSGCVWYGSIPEQVRREFGPRPFTTFATADSMRWFYDCSGIAVFFSKIDSGWYVAAISVTRPKVFQLDQRAGGLVACKTGARL